MHRIPSGQAAAAQAFFDYITSAEASEIIVAAGVVPAN